MKRRDFLKLATTAAATTLALPACQSLTPASPTPTLPSAVMPTITPALKPSVPAMSLPGTEMWTMVSSVTEQEYRIVAGRRGKDIDGPLPVIYITDGNGNFPLVYALHQQLADDGYLPPALLVGMDFPFDEWDAYKDLRSRDFTPTVLAGDSYQYLQFPKGTGGAPAFLQFLARDLKPAINARYRTVADDATLAGHSLGGLFALYALFKQPDLFQRYLIGSPSIWYDNRTILNNLATYADTHTDLAAHVFMGVGGGEDGMVSDLQLLADRLDGYHYSNLTMHQRVFEGETHLSMISFFFSIGLRALYG